MGHELTLHLVAGLILHMRALPNGIDVTVFARKHLQQRIVFAAIVGAEHVRLLRDNQLTLGWSNEVLPVNATEAAAIVAFAELAKVTP